MSISAISSGNIPINTEKNITLKRDNEVLADASSLIRQEIKTEESYSNKAMKSEAYSNVQAGSEVENSKSLTAQEKLKQDTQNIKLEQAIESVSQFVNTAKKDVDFSIDEDSGKNVVKIIDRESQELIRQFPSEEIISMALKIQELQDKLTSKSGLFLDESI